MSGISNYNFTASSFKADTLTENRVVFVNSEGTLIDNANLLFNNNILATDSILLASENDGTLKINDVSGTNTVGKSLTISSGRSTGTATGGNIIFETTAYASNVPLIGTITQDDVIDYYYIDFLIMNFANLSAFILLNFLSPLIINGSKNKEAISKAKTSILGSFFSLCQLILPAK